MNIKKIILSEIEDFQWIRDIGNPIPISIHYEYQIQVCGKNKRRYEEVVEKLESLYGVELVFRVRESVDLSIYDGTYRGVIFYIEGENQYVEYNECTEINDYPNYPVVDIEDFMRFVIE